MIKKMAALLFCLAVALGLSACQNPGKQPVQEAGKLQVSVSFNAMKEFVLAVGGENVAVSAMIPDGTEAHGFEPKAQDLAKLNTADVFVFNGLGMETWAEEAVRAANNEKLIVVDTSAGADLIEVHDHDDYDEEEDHDHGDYDPHLWLGLTGAQTQAVNIKNALVQADPENADDYEANCAAFTADLDGLLKEYRAKFDALERKNFVTGHAAFGYLCRDFGLVQNSVMSLFAGGEPSAQQLTALVQYCREHNVRTVFSEEMASPAVSQTLANEVGAKVETIFTMETSEDGETYLVRMEQNLAKIYASLAE